MSDAAKPPDGRVCLVGTGPGDCGPIAVRGLESLRQADAVLHDSWVHPQLLCLVKPGSLLICLDGPGGMRNWTKPQILARLVELACAGKTVVWLTDEDPAGLASRAEEARALCQAGVPYEIIPGIASFPDAQRDAALAATVKWFQRRPLRGRCIMVTRPANQVEKLCELLDALGAHVIRQPAIQIGPPPDWGPVDAALADVSAYDWIVFSSSNGVRFLLDRLFERGRDLRVLSRVRLAAIGPGTSEELARYHLRTDRQPETYRAESLAAALSDDAQGKRFLLARASRGREVLAEQLRAAGGQVEQVVVYQSTDCPSPDGHVQSRLVSGQVDYTAVTSSAIARSLLAMFGEDLGKSKLASISPVTSKTLRQIGLEPSVEAATYTMQGVVDAILSDVRDSQGRSTKD